MISAGLLDGDESHAHFFDTPGQLEQYAFAVSRREVALPPGWSRIAHICSKP